MRVVLGFFLLLSGFVARAQAAGSFQQLTGYFLVDCYVETLKSNCTLDIASLKAVEGDSMSCGDGAFYKNISTIYYVAPQALDLRYIDNFAYRVNLQGRQHQVYLSINPLILRGAGPTAGALRRNLQVVNAIKQNQATADLLQQQVDRLQLDFTKKRWYTVLLHGTMSVLVLPDRQAPKTYATPMGYHQYLLLQDKGNRVRVAHLLKDAF
jgi:hypothetical protein